MKHKTPPRIELPPTPETDAAFAIRHNQTCTIAHFRQVMEKMERERDAALQALKDAGKPTVAKIPMVIGTSVIEATHYPENAIGDGSSDTNTKPMDQ